MIDINGNDISKFENYESALRQIEGISREMMRSAPDAETWQMVNEIAIKALWPV